MATTTPNYGWTVPTSTDLVKDGATAIETLGDAIDASMNTALGTKKAGMVLLNTTSFSAVASQSFSDIFSATYDNYLIMANFTSSVNVVIGMKLRVAGADNSTSNYHEHLTINASTGTAYTGAIYPATTSWYPTSSNGTDCIKGFALNVYNPFLSTYTLMNGNHSHSSASGAGSYSGGAIEGGFSATTSFTGFSLIPGSGTITGTVRTYGYNN